MKKATDVFGQWAEIGKDLGMEEGHSKPVGEMLEYAIKKIDKNFSFLDVGCGNGWVVRKVSSSALCLKAVGIDGASQMIENAKSRGSEEYINIDIDLYEPKDKFDLIHSMEVLYYFKKPLIVLENIFENWINENGKFIMGIDFYYENKTSHDWPEKTNVDTMTLLNIKQWEKLVINAGFKNVRSWTVGKKNNWNGTLIISATKS